MTSTIQNFENKVMSLLFNVQSRSVSFSCKKQVSFKFVATVTVCSDFEAKENEI